jgi:hypothetical protein
MTSTYRVCELDFLLSTVLWREQVSDREQEEKQLNRAPDRVILVRRLDVANSDCGSGNAGELSVGIRQKARSRILHLRQIHGGGNEGWVE